MYKSFIWCVAVMVCVSTLKAQFSGQLGEFDHLPQRVYANPALQPTGKVNIGFPGLSNMYFEQSNNWLRPDRYLSVNGQGTATFDQQRLLGDIGTELFNGFGSTLELVHVGVKFGKNYMHFRMAERVQGAFALPRDMLALGVYGNVGDNGFDDHTANLGGLRVDAMHYREYALGYSRTFGENKIGVGLTAKYLYGMEAVHTAQSSLRLRTDPITYALQSSGALLIHTSGLGQGEGGEDVRADVIDYLTKLPNRGFGFDAGAWYKPVNGLTLEFSALDFGVIRWRSDVASFGTTSADFAYNGIDITEFVFLTGNEFDAAFNEEIDRIADEAREVYGIETTHQSFNTSLFGLFRYGASYDLYDLGPFKGKVWANAMHALGHSNLPNRVAVGYNQQLWKVLQVGLHYSRQQGDGGFLGGGITLNGGPFQLYAMVENARIAQWSRYTFVDSEDDSRTQVVVPRHSADLRVHLGINFTFGRSADQGRTRSSSLFK